jgi:GTP-binding protein
MSAFNHAKLALTVAELAQLPPATGYEVAFAGRSNAGKSSAINALTNRRRLAFVARRPGKTRMIQIFELAPARLLVDLPGYGYARVADATRRQWGRLLDDYLAHRESLKGLILIMDARNPLTPLDYQLLDWFLPRRIPVHILLTKAYKLSRSQAATVLQRVERTLAETAIGCTVQLFSSHARVGVAQAQHTITHWLSLPLPDAAKGKNSVPNKNPRLKGSKAGGKSALTRIKAPAQGGEAGDDETSSVK